MDAHRRALLERIMEEPDVKQRIVTVHAPGGPKGLVAFLAMRLEMEVMREKLAGAAEATPAR
jgi:hypothetical protein